ncbi:MAG: hybrid sensor histidine kinase/response regulator [Magnetococcus sp. YQC-5]
MVDKIFGKVDMEQGKYTDAIVLIVDDEPAKNDLLTSILRPHYRVVSVQSGVAAMQHFGSYCLPDVILLKERLPDTNGYELCRTLKNNEKTGHIPVIFLADASFEENATEGFKLGCADYFGQPYIPAIVLARIKSHIEMKRRDGLLAYYTNNHALFMRMLTHEVRTPLAIIDSNCQLLALGEKKCPQPEYLGQIRAATTRLAELFERCLTQDQLVTMDQPRWLPVDLPTLLATVVLEMQRRTDDHLLTIQTEGLPTQMIGDASLLQVMLANLLENAMHYSPDGGCIELVTKSDDEGNLVIEVRDEGIGIAEADLDRVFERYYRTYQVNDVMGAGLGLYIVRNIVRLHGGDILCKSTLGEGSTFRLTLRPSL